jgi:hypothetical protein
MNSPSRTINVFLMIFVCLYGNFSTANNNTSTMNTLLTSMVQGVKGYVKESQERSKHVKAYQWAGQQKNLSAGDLERCKVLIAMQHELLMLQISGAKDQHNNMIHAREKIISGAERPDNIVEVLTSLQANEPKIDWYVHSIKLGPSLGAGGRAYVEYFEQFVKQFRIQKKDEIAKILDDPNLTEKTRNELEERINLELSSMALQRMNTPWIRIEDFIKDRSEWYLNCIKVLGKASKKGDDSALLQSIKLDEQRERKIRSLDYQLNQLEKLILFSKEALQEMSTKIAETEARLYTKAYRASGDQKKKDYDEWGIDAALSLSEAKIKIGKLRNKKLLQEKMKNGQDAAAESNFQEINASAGRITDFKEKLEILGDSESEFDSLMLKVSTANQKIKRQLDRQDDDTLKKIQQDFSIVKSFYHFGFFDDLKRVQSLLSEQIGDHRKNFNNAMISYINVKQSLKQSKLKCIFDNFPRPPAE